jgi:predicted dehydrogenase
MQRIGLIGLDTSHVTAFAQLLNDPAHRHHIPGARVTVAWPGGSPDVAMSISRVEGFTQTLREKYQTAIVGSPADVAAACDLVFIETIDGRRHKALLEQVLPYGKPVFIDKPLACDPDDAQAILDLAAGAGIPLMSCSSLRYDDTLQAALADNTAGAITGCDVFGPMAFLEPFEGLYWYGIHSVEMAVAALGPGCRRVQVVSAPDHDSVTCVWEDGRLATLHGLRNQHSQFGLTLHRQKGVRFVDTANSRPCYASLLEAILRSLPQGRSDIAGADMLEVIRIIDAANTSRRTGAAVTLPAQP